MQLTQPPKWLGGMDARAERPVILVIDDQPAILDMLDYTLALQGYQPVCIANGQEALEWIKNTLHIGRYPMVILLDLHMPVMNGTGFLASLHAQWDEWDAPVPIPPIILLTVDKSDHSHLGCNDVLIKPFRIRDLYERLRLVISPDCFDAGERHGDRAPRKDATMNIALNLTCSELKPGMVVVYLLRANQLPKHPEKEWRGKIKKVYPSIDEVEVEVLSEGYKGDEERVHFEQIVRVESEEEQ